MAPLPYSKSTPIEVINALQRNQSILVSLAVSMNARSQSFYMDNGNLGWPWLNTNILNITKSYVVGILH